MSFGAVRGAAPDVRLIERPGPPLGSPAGDCPSAGRRKREAGVEGTSARPRVSPVNTATPSRWEVVPCALPARSRGMRTGGGPPPRPSRPRHEEQPHRVGTAVHVPQTRDMLGDELSGDEALTALRRYGGPAAADRLLRPLPLRGRLHQRAGPRLPGGARPGPVHHRARRPRHVGAHRGRGFSGSSSSPSAGSCRAPVPTSWRRRSRAPGAVRRQRRVEHARTSGWGWRSPY